MHIQENSDISKNIDEHSEQPKQITDNEPSESISLRSSIRKVVSSPVKVECPPGFSGLLPLQETCKKFLQCASGRSFVMDCGPGTVFNPITMVCDWPYNVPDCNDGKFIKKLY